MREEAERSATMSAADGQPGQGGADRPSESDEERRRRERQEAKENRRATRLANLGFGRRALLAYDEPAEITIQMAQAAVLVTLHHHAQDAAQALRLTHERLQRTETTTTKAGATRERIRYPSATRRRRRSWNGLRVRARRPN